jgi:hypothetical protein
MHFADKRSGSAAYHSHIQLSIEHHVDSFQMKLVRAVTAFRFDNLFC